MKTPIELTIIIPTYNEAKRIEKTLERLALYLKTDLAGHSVEVLVVDADSPDGTAQLVEKHKKDFSYLMVISAGPKPPKKFVKGKQVALGMLKAQGEYVLFMDADLATPLKYLKNVFELIDQNKPVGICVRDLGSSHTGVRKFVSNTGNLVVRSLVTPGIRDTQCGFKLFRSDAAKLIFSQQRITSWGFDMEALALARKYHYPIELIDVPDWKDVGGGKIGGTSALKAAIQTLPDVLRIRWGLMTGKYKSAKGA